MSAGRCISACSLDARSRDGLASLVTTLLVTLAIVVPLVWLILMLRVEAISAYATVQAFLASNPSLPPAMRDLPWIGQAAAGNAATDVGRSDCHSVSSSCC